MRPLDEGELAAMVRGASGPLCLRGGGTRALREMPGEVLDLSGLSGITLYEPAALTLVARAGTGVAEVEAALAAEGQRLAFEVPDLRAVLGRAGVSTLGGVVAANASGPRRVQVGACRDATLGLRFVDGRGDVIRNGGRVMKNVTGYDLVKLLAGSHGTLGVLSEVSLRVQARPEAEVTLISTPMEAAAAVAAMAMALTSPFDVSGAAWDGRVMIRLEGLAGSVGYRSGALCKRLPGDWDRLEAEESAAAWRGVRDVAPLVGAAGALWRLSVKPSDAPAVLAALPGARAMLDWGGGLIWLRLPEGEAVRDVVARLGGHATLLQGAADIPAFQPEAPGVAALSAALRGRFDPRGIFNRGLMG